MKNFNYLICLLIFSSNLFSQQPTFDWVMQLGSTSTEFSGKILLDSEGNIYHIGSFYTSLDFDPGPNLAMRYSTGRTDVFIQKLSSNGNLLWIKTFGSSLDDVVADAIIDPNDNLIIIGKTSGTVNFIFSSGYTINAVGSFVAQYDKMGNLKKFENDLPNDIYAINSNDFGELFLTGDFNRTTDFDPDTSVLNISPTSNVKDIFIQKLDSNWKLKWVKTIGGGLGSEGLKIKIDQSNNVYLSGSYRGWVDFDPGNGNYYKVSNGGWNNDLYILKLDSIGNFVWVNTIGSNNNEYLSSFKLGENGSSFIFGLYQDTLNYQHSSTVGSIVSNGGSDFFIQKLDANGNLDWIHSFGGTLNDSSGDLEIDSLENVYLIGLFSSTVDFDPSSNVAALTSSGLYYNGYVFKLDKNGAYSWSRRLPSTGFLNLKSILIDENIDVFIAGDFRDSLYIDNSASGAQLSGLGLNDIFFFKLNQNQTTIIPEISNNNLLQIFPNPNNGFFTLINEEAIDKILIRNGLGQIVFKKESVINLKEELQLNLKSGVYFLTVYSNNEINSKRFVVK